MKIKERKERVKKEAESAKQSDKDRAAEEKKEE